MHDIIGSGVLNGDGSCDFSWTIGGRPSNGFYYSFPSLRDLSAYLDREDIGDYSFADSADIDGVRDLTVHARVCEACQDPLTRDSVGNEERFCSTGCAVAALLGTK